MKNKITKPQQWVRAAASFYEVLVPTTITTPTCIIPNRQKMRGLVIVGTQSDLVLRCTSFIYYFFLRDKHYRHIMIGHLFWLPDASSDSMPDVFGDAQPPTHYLNVLFGTNCNCSAKVFIKLKIIDFAWKYILTFLK